MIKNNVTVFIEVFNEEKRIESCLKSFSWADELVVFNKNSTDRTREIALTYASEVIDVPFGQASENLVTNISGRRSKEWVFFPTASNFIHPALVDEIVKLTSNESFPYDVIGIPYAIYSLGINSKYSPWTDIRKYTLIRRSTLELSEKLHHEIRSNSSRVYDIPLLSPEKVLYHCTNRDADDYFERQIRYTRYEARYDSTYSRDGALRKTLFQIFKAIAIVVIKRRSFMLGWDGIALGLSYISYFIMKFIYTWDASRENGNSVYPILRQRIDDLWEKRHLNPEEK